MFRIGDIVEVIGAHSHHDNPFIGMVGTILGHYYSDENIYAVKFDISGLPLPGMHDCGEKDPTNRSRYFRSENLKLALDEEELEKRKIEKKLKKEKYKHIDPFDEEVW